LGNVVLAGSSKTFRSTGGILQFGNAGTDLLTISGASVLKSDSTQTVTVASQIRMNARLGIETGALFLNQISGSSSDLNLAVDDVNLGGTVALGTGVMSLTTQAAIPISLGDNSLGLNLDKTELSLITSAGGLSIDDLSGSGVFVDNVQQADVAGITGSVRLVTPVDVAIMSPSTLPRVGIDARDLVGINNLTFNTLSQLALAAPVADINVAVAGPLAITGAVLIGNGRAFQVDSSGGIQSSAPIRADGLVNLAADGNISLGGTVSSAAGVSINPRGGYFINNGGASVFDSAALASASGVRIVTKDLFSPDLAVGYAQGLQVVFGVSDPALLGRNQIGSMANFTDGNFSPYYFEFATGTAQPYIFAQQTAVPIVQSPVALRLTGAFPSPVRYSEEELELLTPEERSAYEAQQRGRAAKVILQSSAGSEEIGGSSVTPQATREAPKPDREAPTAQVLLQGKPLVRNSPHPGRHDTTRLLRVGASRAVALRGAEVNLVEILMAEKMSAEIDVGSRPFAAQR
jgi:hypothetical protein